MVKLPTVQKVIAAQKAAAKDTTGTFNLGAPPCPEAGLIPSAAGLTGQCGLGEYPATTLPELTPMVYWGGHVQVHPKEFVVFWGWGQDGAWTPAELASKACATPETVTETTITGSQSVTLPCDPIGAGKYFADFVAQLGGTQWAEVQDQYFQTVNGTTTNIDETKNVLGGMWVDNTIPNDPANPKDPNNFENTLGSNPAGSTNTYTLMAREASRAVAYFENTGQLNKADVPDSNIILVQPDLLTDPNALASGYCAFHDYTDFAAPGNSYYGDSQVTQDIQYTNLPYFSNSALATACGQQTVNTGNQGNLDSWSIAGGHEIEEAATDPGSEDIEGSYSGGTQKFLGGWYDAADANENGDKCAYVGTPITGITGLSTGVGPTELPVPGAMGNIKGSGGGTFAVQSLWSNAAAEGAGYCAGSGNDLPGPLAGDPPYSGATYIAASKKAIAAGKKAKQQHSSKKHAKKVSYRVV